MPTNARHWVDKNCLPWSKDYLNEKIVNTKAETESHTFVVSSIDSVDGHCDVTQRKGKVLCIYDMKLLFSIEGSKKDLHDRVSATVTLDEFVHDQDDDEYVFSVTSAHADDINKSLVPVLRAKLQKFQQDLIAAHKRDMQHATGH